MAITQEIFEAYLHCPTKCHLVAHGTEAECAPHLPQMTQVNDTFRCEGVSRMCAGVPADEIRIGLPTLIALKQQRYRVVVDCGLLTPSLAAEVHGFHRSSRDKRAGKGMYTPFRFVTTEKVCDVDRMLLAFDALVFSQAFAPAPQAGEII